MQTDISIFEGISATPTTRSTSLKFPFSRRRTNAVLPRLQGRFVATREPSPEVLDLTNLPEQEPVKHPRAAALRKLH